MSYAQSVEVIYSNPNFCEKDKKSIKGKETIHQLLNQIIDIAKKKGCLVGKQELYFSHPSLVLDYDFQSLYRELIYQFFQNTSGCEFTHWAPVHIKMFDNWFLHNEEYVRLQAILGNSTDQTVFFVNPNINVVLNSFPKGVLTFEQFDHHLSNIIPNHVTKFSIMVKNDSASLEFYNVSKAFEYMKSKQII
ncbi:MAG: hypothetical protein ACRCXZ_02820 [Patescibacteria group bacterium]